MVRLSYELSVVFDHNPIIEIKPWLSMSFSKLARASLERDGGNFGRYGLLWRILRSFYRCRSPSSVARSHFAKLASVS